MAKLLKKHLGIGVKKQTSNSPKLECDSPPQGLERSRPNQSGEPIASDKDSLSTALSAATGGCDDFPPPPGAWTLQQALGEASGVQGFGGARPKDSKGYRPQVADGGVDQSSFLDFSSETADSDFAEFTKNIGKRSKESNHIYENQVMFDPLPQFIGSESLQEVKKWLGEVKLIPTTDASHSVPSNDFRPKMAYEAQLKSTEKPRSPNMSRKISALVAENASERKSAVVKTAENRTTGLKLKESEYEKSNPATREPDYERYTQLRDELKLELEQQLSEILEEESVCLSAPEGGIEPVTRDTENLMVRSDGYEEPWDLEAAQGQIEEEFDGVLVGEWILRENPADNVVTGTQPLPAPSELPEGLLPHELDIRTQKGYEKPWDWKPHMKDDRGPEGYEKPWDWKPHMKDDRPPKEYEEPWDKKAKNVENEVIAAKIAKEAVRAGKDGAGVAVPHVRASDDVRGQDGYDKPWDIKPHLKDGRPPDEYEEPWDKKAKDIESELIVAKIAKEAAKACAAGEIGAERQLSSAAAGVVAAAVRRNPKDAVGNAQKPSRVLASAGEGDGKPLGPRVSSPAVRRQRISPKKRTGLTSDLENSPRNRVGERIQTRIPLDEQRWYHGTISRGDAETILHDHREGSYLVRHSESGTDEFSLSVKSSRGFMHMKIVLDPERKFILGQFSQPFVSIPQMIQYYTVSKLPIKGAEHMSLLFPVNRKVV